MSRLAQTMLTGIILVGLAGISNPAPAASHSGHKGHKASQGHKGHKGHRAATAPTCKNCGMQHATRKSKAKPRMVKISGRTYYCCPSCGPHFKRKV